MEVDYKAIGQRIKIARIKKGVTQETVADLIDITPAHMSNVETGKTKVSLPTLIAIANALSVSVDTLLCDNVIASKIIFEKEAKDIFSDCDEYEVRFLVDLMKSAKIAFRKDKDIRNSKITVAVRHINVYYRLRSFYIIYPTIFQLLSFCNTSSYCDTCVAFV